MQVTTIGLDLAKNIFQIHGVTDEGDVAFNRSLRRAQVLTFFESLAPCLVGIEACGTSHYWAREIKKLGHEVLLIPPAYVKPYVKRSITGCTRCTTEDEPRRRTNHRLRYRRFDR